MIVANATGWADFPPTDPQQTFADGASGPPIRVGVAVDDDAPVYLWGGYIDSQAPGFDAEAGETVTLDCIDAKGEAGRAFVAELTAAVGANQPADTRINAILDAIDWPSWRRDLDASSVQLKATMYGAQAVDLMNLAADSSGGVVFGDVNGHVAYRHRDWQRAHPRHPDRRDDRQLRDGTVTAELVEDPPGSGLYDPRLASSRTRRLRPVSARRPARRRPRLRSVPRRRRPLAACPVSWETAFSREDISTKVVISRHDDADATPPIAPVVRDDVEARRCSAPKRSNVPTWKPASRSTWSSIAERIFEVRSWRYMPRIAAVTLDAATAPDVVDVLVAADPYQPARFNCRHRGDDGRDVFARTMIVVGVEHSITPEGWTARIALDDAAPFLSPSTARWSDGTAEPARWNNGTTPNALGSTWAHAA